MDSAWSTPTTNEESSSVQPDISMIRSSEDSSAPTKRKAAERGHQQQQQQQHPGSSEEVTWVPMERTESLKSGEQGDASFLPAVPSLPASLPTISSSAPPVGTEEKPFEFQPPPDQSNLSDPQNQNQTVSGQTSDSGDPQENPEGPLDPLEETESPSLWSLTVSGQTRRDRFIPLPWHSGEKHSIQWRPLSK
jgi:hypothetical protein